MSILKYLTNMQNDAASSDARPSPPKRFQFDVFTDGSEIKEKKTFKTLGLGWGYVLKKNKTTIHEANGSIPEGNNQRVELLAIHKALQHLTQKGVQNADITVYSDSEYSIKCITLWSNTWKRNGWKKTGTSIPVKHRDLIEPCVNMYAKLRLQNDVRFQHVRSHKYAKGFAGEMDYLSRGNDEADTLATSASKSMLKLNVITS